MSGRVTIALAAALVLPALLAAVRRQQEGATTPTTTTAAAKQNGCDVVASPPSITPRKEKKPTAQLTKNKVYDVTMVTNCGSFTIQMDQKQSPNAAASFVPSCSRGSSTTRSSTGSSRDS